MKLNRLFFFTFMILYITSCSRISNVHNHKFRDDIKFKTVFEAFSNKPSGGLNFFFTRSWLGSCQFLEGEDAGLEINQVRLVINCSPELFINDQQGNYKDFTQSGFMFQFDDYCSIVIDFNTEKSIYIDSANIVYKKKNKKNNENLNIKLDSEILLDFIYSGDQKKMGEYLGTQSIIRFETYYSDIYSYKSRFWGF